MKIKNIHINNYKVFQDFDLDLTDNGKSQNLIVIAGINGSGKTTLLKEVILPIFKNRTILKESFLDIEFIHNEQLYTLQLNSSTINSGNYPDSNYRHALFSNLKNIIFYPANGSDKKNAEENIIRFIDHLIYEEDKKSSEAYQIVQEILNGIFNDFEIQVEFNGLNQKREVLFKNNISDRIKINELSGGEQELITKAFSLYLANVKDSIIIIDEPESSLHPNWQNRIASIYQNFADKNNNQVILATHSPHIVASVRKEQIRILIKELGKIKAIQNFSGSYGWRIDKILLEIFRLTGLRTPIVEKEIEELKQMVFENRFEEGSFADKMNHLVNILGYDDQDLTLLRFEIQQRKRHNEKNK